MNKDICTVSIVVPCYNEADGVNNLVSRLDDFEKKLNRPHELVLVDDGSRDATYEKLRNFYKERIGRDVKIIKHNENKSVGGALKTGFRNASGDYIATIDSDCTYDLNYLLEMLDIAITNNADIVTASPYHPEGSTSGVPAYRLFLSRNLSRLYNLVSDSRFYTYTSIFRIYRGDAIKNLRFDSDGFLAMAEVLIKAYKKGLKIIEYPATLKGREYGASSAKVLKLIREHLLFIIKLLLKKV